MALPIQKLPMLVIHLILQTVGFLDMFLLTRTSTKMRRIVQNMNRTPKHYLCVTIANQIMIQIQSKTNEEYSELMIVTDKENEPERRYTFKMEIGSVDYLPSELLARALVLVLADGQVVVETYWNDVKSGCIELCNELVQVFNTPVRAVTLKLDEIENYQNAINWINSTFQGLILVKIEGDCNFQDYMWIMKNAKATKELRFEMKPNDYPKDTENLEVIPFELEGIEILHGKWINFQQLEAIKSDYIKIANIDWTDFKINTFLKNLKSSKEKPKFKELDIIIHRQSTHVVFEGLQERDAPDTDKKLVFKTVNGQKCTVTYTRFVRNVHEDNNLFGFEILIKD
ncbi:hypothetical protein CAEBREN_02785 [Caenorhabditis brenneri]|uniref:F-box domain-containing protein n=1 Tax=Caenorhabditis brenneri TaxID=135651 RepID=G0NGL5_CAEBE|nr:hypothetical protein CAEBREN_02785 [Caenorhabditis brenneri]